MGLFPPSERGREVHVRAYKWLVKGIFNFSKIPFLYLVPIHTHRHPHTPHHFTPSVANGCNSLSKATVSLVEKNGSSPIPALDRWRGSLQNYRNPSLKGDQTYYITLHHWLYMYVTQKLYSSYEWGYEPYMYMYMYKHGVWNEYHKEKFTITTMNCPAQSDHM